MSTPTTFRPSKIVIFLEGLIVMFTNDPTKCRIGLLGQAPHHKKLIEILDKDTRSTELSIGEGGVVGDFSLEVSNTTISGIRRRHPNEQIDRSTGPAAGAAQRETSKWLIDFEKDFYRRPIGAFRSQFIAMVTVNNGEIFTNLISDNFLQYQQAFSTQPPTHLGRVAVGMGIEINLDRPESKAVFKKGESELITLAPPKNYQMHIFRTDTQTDHIGGDADYYFTALGRDLLPSEMLSFRSFPEPPKGPEPPSTPDATCPVVEMSLSNPT